MKRFGGLKLYLVHHLKKIIDAFDAPSNDDYDSFVIQQFSIFESHALQLTHGLPNVIHRIHHQVYTILQAIYMTLSNRYIYNYIMKVTHIQSIIFIVYTMKGFEYCQSQ